MTIDEMRQNGSSNHKQKFVDRMYIETYGNFDPRVHKENYKLLGKLYVYCYDCGTFNSSVSGVLKKHYNSPKHKFNVFLTGLAKNGTWPIEYSVEDIAKEYMSYSENRSRVFHVVDDWDDEVPKRVMRIPACVQK